MADGIYEQAGDSFRLKKNVSKVIRYPAFTYTIYTNELGFRDSSTGPRELRERPFDVFLGASDVFGNGVEYAESFVGIVAAAAATKGREVLNLATGGHYFLEQEATSQATRGDHSPDAIEGLLLRQRLAYPEIRSEEPEHHRQERIRYGPERLAGDVSPSFGGELVLRFLLLPG